jgi:CRP-like cAMP-binding protein
MPAMEQLPALPERPMSYRILKELDLFADLPKQEVTRFADAARIKFYKKGQYLYSEAEEAKSFYVICSGWVKLLHITKDGEEVVIAMLAANNITGESAIFEDGNFASTAQIAEDAQILSIPITLLKERIRVSNALALNMLASMVRYQRQHEMQMEQFLLYSAPQRVGCFLLGLCPVQQQKDGMALDLPYDKTLIANMLGMKGPTFSRALKVLRDETGTEVSGARVTIHSMNRLLTFVNGCYSPHHLQRK